MPLFKLWKCFVMEEVKEDKRREIDYARMLYILQKEMLTFDEAIFYLDCSDSHMYKLTSHRQIPHYAPSGKLIYFRRSEIDEWVFARKRATRDELANLEELDEN